jgi:hypothetical protein
MADFPRRDLHLLELDHQRLSYHDTRRKHRCRPAQILRGILAWQRSVSALILRRVDVAACLCIHPLALTLGACSSSYEMGAAFPACGI